MLIDEELLLNVASQKLLTALTVSSSSASMLFGEYVEACIISQSPSNFRKYHYQRDENIAPNR